MSNNLQEIIKPLLQIQELDIDIISLLKAKQDGERELAMIKESRENLLAELTANRKRLETAKAKTKELAEIAAKDEAKKKQLEDELAKATKLELIRAMQMEIARIKKSLALSEEQQEIFLDMQLKEEEELTKAEQDLAAYAKEYEEMKVQKELELAEIDKDVDVRKEARKELKEKADPEVYATYSRLMFSKLERVIVPIHGLSCGACHISVTAQHENIVKMKSKLTTCENCSVIHWISDDQSPVAGAGTVKGKKRRASSRTT